MKLSCHSTCNGWIDVLLLFDKIFLENFQEKWQWCIGDTFVSLKPCLLLSVLWKNILCLDQEEKWKRKNQVKTNINFCFFWTLLSWKKISTLSLSQAWITTTLSVSLIQETKTLKTTKTEENYSCEKIRKLDFDIILITYLLYMALMLCFGQNISFSVLQDSADQYIHLSTNYYFQIWLFLPCTVFFFNVKKGPYWWKVA